MRDENTKSNLLEALERVNTFINYYEKEVDEINFEELMEIYSSISILSYKADLSGIDIAEAEEEIFIPCEKLQKRVIVLIKEKLEEEYKNAKH